MRISRTCSAALLVTAALAVASAFACAPVRRPGDPARLSSDDGDATYAHLDAKLAAEWSRWEAARAALLKRVTTEQKTVARDEWEQMLAGTGELALTASDLASLRARHEQIIEEARVRARERSALDLDQLRGEGTEAVAKFCRELPKGGMLHVHPWGTLDRPTARAILEKVNPALDFPKLLVSLDDPGGTGALYPHELERLRAVGARHPSGVRFLDLTGDDRRVIEDLFFLPPGAHPFDRFTAVFTAISAMVFANAAVDPEPMMWDAFLTRAREHRLRYVEVSRNIVPRPQWFQGLDAWAAEKANPPTSMVVRLHAAFNRNKDAAFTRGKADQLLKFPPSNILTGIDILADETATPLLEHGQTLFVPVLDAVNKGTSKLHRTAHAGELGDVRNVRDAIIMGVERIGHGVKLEDDPVALEWARLHALPIEVNLVSNLRLSVVPKIQDHPFLRFARLGLDVSLSTDDEGIFETTIDDECVTAIEGTDVAYDELKTFSFTAIKTAFVDEPTRKSLEQALTQDFVHFEQDWARLAQPD
jgi:adenosine deaminase